MDILYRRFILVAALIAAFGGVTANLIQETRKVDDLNTFNPAYAISCKNQQICARTPASPEILIFAAIG
jgi:hypothetical protein